VPADQILIVGFRDRGLAIAGGRLGEELELERAHDCGRNLILDFEDVVKLTVVGFRPQVVSVISPYELRRYAQVIAGFATLPSRTYATISRFAIVGMSSDLPLK
jgi:hypothetical protein